MTILVTGGTGTLGTPTVALLRAAGHHIRILSRKQGADRVQGDLTTGAGLTEALAGVDTVLHLATSASSKDVPQATLLLEAAKAAGVTHVVYISIVGVDKVPYSYYRAKLSTERVIEESGIPFTILRATQFHDFIVMFIGLQKRLPVLLSLDVLDQPIEVEEVAARLVEIVDAGPSGRAADIGGPEQIAVRDGIVAWQAATGDRRRVWTLHLVGKTIRAFKAGYHMTAMPGFGRKTFAEYLAAKK